MAIAIEPGEELPIILKDDANKPVEKQRRFYSHALTMRKQRIIFREIDKLYEEETPEGETKEAKPFDSDQFFDRVLALLSKYLVRWENAGFDFDPAHFEDVFSSGQAIELLRKIASNQHASPEEKKS